MWTEHRSKANFGERPLIGKPLVAVHGVCIRGQSTRSIRLARRTRRGVVEGLSDVARLRILSILLSVMCSWTIGPFTVDLGASLTAGRAYYDWLTEKYHPNNSDRLLRSRINFPASCRCHTRKSMGCV